MVKIAVHAHELLQPRLASRPFWQRRLRLQQRSSLFLRAKIAVHEPRQFLLASLPIWQRRRAATVSAFPTGAFNSIGYSKFIQNYWWLRSPTTDRDYNAWLVDPGGDIVGFSFDSYVSDSYGRVYFRRIHSCITIIRLSM